METPPKEITALELFWNHFFDAETGAYEKSSWLDLFLAEFMIRINEGANPKSLIKSCPLSAVVSLVGCELLCGIHRVTSSINTHYTAPSTSASPLVDNVDITDELASNAPSAVGSENAREEAKSNQSQPTSMFTRANSQSSTEILKRYLLSGVSWRCLVLLKTLGVERNAPDTLMEHLVSMVGGGLLTSSNCEPGVSCCRQLSFVLIWLFGELGSLSGNPQSSEAPYTTYSVERTRSPIHQLFSPRIWSKKSSSTSWNSGSPFERGSPNYRLKHLDKNKGVSDNNEKKNSDSKNEDTSDTDDTSGDLQILNRSLTLKVASKHDSFDYFNSRIQSPVGLSSDSVFNDPFHSPRKTKPKVEDYKNDQHRDIMNSEVDSFNFALLILDILQDLCKTESSLSGSEGSQISLQCVNFALKNLCSLQFGSVPNVSMQEDNGETSIVKVALTELLMISLDKVLVCPDLCVKLINNGILPMMLRLLEDAIRKSSSKYHTNKDDRRQKKIDVPKSLEANCLLHFLFGVAYSIIVYFYCLLIQCRTVESLRKFTDHFKLYGDCLKGDLLKECIELMIRTPNDDDDEEAVLLIKKILDAVGKLIAELKRTRSEIIHSAACPKTRHKVCRQRVADGMHHHHDILGEVSPGISLAPACCVSVLYGTLTSLLTDEEVTAKAVLCNKALCVMLKCGICCCFSPGFLMECIVRLILTHNTSTVLSLQLLEHTVYGELGAGVLTPKETDQLPCSVCEPEDESLVKKYCPQGVTIKDRKSTWSFLIHYNSLLQLDNHNNVLLETVGHLLRVTPKCRPEMKYELLFSVIYPTFIVAKHRYSIRQEECAYFLTVSCLNIFTSLLNSVHFAEKFIERGGLSYVLELVSLPQFSKQCCSILEIAIIVDILKLLQGSNDYMDEINSLTSVEMLFNTLSDLTNKCFKTYRSKLSDNKFNELVDLSNEKEMLMLLTNLPRRGSHQVAGKVSATKVVQTPYATEESVTEEITEDHIELLKNVWTFWKTCSSLCLYSPVFRQLMVKREVFLDSYGLLKLMLHYLCYEECATVEMRLLVKVIESLLTVQFSVADSTSMRSKEVSLLVVRAALASDNTTDGGSFVTGAGGSVLRSLCEALVRVAIAAPSRTHSMPRVEKPKMPPLNCSSYDRCLEYSSSEDSVGGGPYASESEQHSRPDEGYEADVELSKQDVSKAKLRKLTSNTMNFNNMSDRFSPPLGVECGEYNKSSELVHPELCVIVLDMLTQLIDKLVRSKEEDGAYSELCSACCGLARACCGRLSTALPAVSSSPPSLLQRLLTPSAASLLAHTAPRLAELQSSISELIHVLASQSIEPSELWSLLRLLAAPSPPITPLLTAIRRLLAAAQPNTPDCILTFPVDAEATDEVMQKLRSSELSQMANTASSQNQQAESYASYLHEAHKTNRLSSPWSQSAVRCGVSAGWAPWVQGAALAMWLRAAPASTPLAAQSDHSDGWRDDSFNFSPPPKDKKPSKKEPSAKSVVELYHVFSMGNETLLFEVWLDVTTGSFTFRLTRPEAGSYKILSETHIEGALTLHRWSHVAMNIREVVQKRKIHIQVTLFVSGVECETVSLPLQGLLVRKVSPIIVLIGDAQRRAGGGAHAYHLSSVTLHRSPVYNAAIAVHCTAHGPDSSCRVRCECPNYPLVITPASLNSNIDWDQVYDMSTTTIRELHESVLLTFSAHSCTIINLYHQGAALPTVFSGRVASTASLMASSTTSGTGSGGGGRPSIPEALLPTWTGAALLSKHRALPPALYMLGGVHLPLYLFARVVELDGSEEEQAIALWVLLRACRADSRLYSALYGGDTLDMLHTVLASPKCRVSRHLLKVFLDEACSSPVLTLSTEGAVVSVRGDCVLVEPQLLVFLTRASKHFTEEINWEVERSEGREKWSGTLWALALSAMGALLRDDHPRRSFNHYQMNRLDLPRHLLTACKERFLNSDSGSLEPAATQNLVELIRGLLGSPPPLCYLALLADFLVLMHQASDTFVTHSRGNFYFLLTSEQPNQNDYNLLNFMTKRESPPKRTKRKSRADSKSTGNTENTVHDKRGIALKDLTGFHEDYLPDSSVDSTKYLKDVINNEIKKGERKRASSTSDISEPFPVDESGAEDVVDGVVTKYEPDVYPSAVPVAESKRERTNVEEAVEVKSTLGEETVDGFVLIDFDDVTHTTVEVCNSGIHEQTSKMEEKRVRAGALDESSLCEGLLLVLRDAVLMLPDHSLQQVMMGALQLDSLVVLANARDSKVRAAVLRLLSALVKRVPPDLRRRTLPLHFYMHLADQISLYPGTWELAEAAAALLTGNDASLEDQLDDEIWSEMSEEWITRSPPLLALLPCSLHLVPVAHNLTLLLRRLREKAPLKMLNEVCFPEVLVKSVRNAAMLPPHLDGRQLLIEDIHDTLAGYTLQALSANHSAQMVTDIHYMLWYIESAAQGESDSSERVRRAARDAQCALFTAQLDYLEERLLSTAATPKPAGYFTTVLSTAVSLGLESAPRAELAARHLHTAQRCVTFLQSCSPRHTLHAEAALFHRLMHTLLTAVSGRSGSGARPKWWLSSIGEWMASLQEALWWGLAPACGTRALQPTLLRTLYTNTNAHHALLSPNPAATRKFAVYLLTTIQHIHLETEEGRISESDAVALGVTDWARSLALGMQTAQADRVPADTLHHEANALLKADETRWEQRNRSNRRRTIISKVVFSRNALANTLTDSAMTMTRKVVDIQNGERKSLMEHLRRTQADSVAAVQRWQQLILDYTHEKALWHDPLSYPQAWQLDPTEGPGRVRVRLRRSHLNIAPRFLKPHYQYKAETMNRPGPLRSVISGWWGLRGGVVARLQPNETVSYMAHVIYVTVASETSGELLLSDRWIHFVPEQDEDCKHRHYDEEGCGAQSWPLDSVVSVATRRWCLQERAAELFLNSGHAHLIAFDSGDLRNTFLEALAPVHLTDETEPESLTEAMTQWRSGSITNWEYIMKLNGLAGRSYNDLMQYPVLPFVIADYTSRILDLTDPTSFRDLAKPMAVQNKQREQHYINTYNDLKAARRDGCSPLLSRTPHHYASLYSNSGGVLHYLVRLPPFTELFLNYQDNNFDMPDRTFHSLATTWRLITKDSPTDVKELIPELFYLPELFHNNEGLNLGVRQCGLGVDDVELPAWAADARIFTLAHRQALETPLVTENLPHWIDLIFGYKQTGQAAVDAINVFPACTYYGFDPSALEDEVDRTAAAAMVRTYGQAPRQLLRHPHPHRAADLTPAQIQPSSVPEVWGGLAGARWGRYCGSPELPPAVCVSRRLCPSAARLHALASSRSVAAASRHTALFSTRSDSAASASGQSGGNTTSTPALLSWGHSDTLLRVKRRRDARHELVARVPPMDQITCVATSCASPSCPVLIGHTSGRVLALHVRSGAGSLLHVSTRQLHAHSAPVHAAYASAPAATAVTASLDGEIVLWDLNKLSYIRTLPNRDMLPVTLVTISDTLCDVASVHELAARHNRNDTSFRNSVSTPSTPNTPNVDYDSDSYEKNAIHKHKSLIRVHTVNASFVGSVSVAERVTSICYSNAPEGVSVNCVVVGLESGGVRFYSSWDLRPVTYIPPADSSRPLLSIAFSTDSSVLFGCYADGTVVAWESGGSRGGSVRIHPAHALF